MVTVACLNKGFYSGGGVQLRQDLESCGFAGAKGRFLWPLPDWLLHGDYIIDYSCLNLHIVKHLKYGKMEVNKSREIVIISFDRGPVL